jgi:hypothetical protein
LLPGSSETTIDAVSRSNFIVVAEVSNVAMPLIGAGSLQCKVEIQLKEILNGNSGDNSAWIPITVDLEPKDESIPEKGKKYIFILKQLGTDQIAFIKMLQASDENIAHIKEMVEKSQTSKAETRPAQTKTQGSLVSTTKP